MAILNLKAFNTAIGKLPKKVKQEAAERERKLCAELHRLVTSLTPVWSGETLANYVWSFDTPYTGPLIEPAGDGDPGPTNKMALGVEPRRPANQAIADASFAALDFTTSHKKVYLSNRCPQFDGLEHGKLPDGKGQVQRSPNGMLGISYMTVLSKMQSGAL